MAAKPDQAQVLKAIDVYMPLAYGSDTPPVTVRSLIATLNGFAGDFFSAPVFAKDPHVPPTRYSLRLGNSFYPHMKLVFQLSPNDEVFLFKADTHDKHCCPPERSAEHAAFMELMGKNQKLSERIEAAWGESGLPTFKTYLRDDLARRKGN